MRRHSAADVLPREYYNVSRTPNTDKVQRAGRNNHLHLSLTTIIIDTLSKTNIYQDTQPPNYSHPPRPARVYLQFEPTTHHLEYTTRRTLSKQLKHKMCRQYYHKLQCGKHKVHATTVQCPESARLNAPLDKCYSNSITKPLARCHKEPNGELCHSWCEDCYGPKPVQSKNRR